MSVLESVLRGKQPSLRKPQKKNLWPGQKFVMLQWGLGLNEVGDHCIRVSSYMFAKICSDLTVDQNFNIHQRKFWWQLDAQSVMFAWVCPLSGCFSAFQSLTFFLFVSSMKIMHFPLHEAWGSLWLLSPSALRLKTVKTIRCCCCLAVNPFCLFDFCFPPLLTFSLRQKLTYSLIMSHSWDTCQIYKAQLTFRMALRGRNLPACPLSLSVRLHIRWFKGQLGVTEDTRLLQGHNLWPERSPVPIRGGDVRSCPPQENTSRGTVRLKILH